MIVDAHQHFWRLDAQDQPWRDDRHDAIATDYTPDDLAAELKQAGVDATVLIQSVDEPAENDRLAAYAEQTPYVAGVVGWLPLATAGAARAELDRIDVPRLKGVRCLIGRDPLDWLAAGDTVRLFGELAARGLSWDVVPVTDEQIAAVLGLARAVPELRIVVDHLARPPLDTGGWEPWAGRLRQLGECPNLALKVSVGIDVLTAWPRWRPEDLPRYAGHALECFGPDRLMLASNWPVIRLRAGYDEAWTDLRKALGSTDTAAVLGGTAEHWYRLDEG